MAKIKIKNSVTAGSAPSGLSFGEMAVNITDKKIFIGNAVEGVVTLHDQQNVVTSVNGATGAITNVAKTNVAQTFTQLQDFSVGISAASILAQTVGGDEGGQVDFGNPVTNTSLTGGIAIDIYQNRMRFFEKGGTARGYYIDLTTGAGGAGTNLVSSGAVSSVSGSGNGISVSPTTGAVIVSNTGVHSINGATGAITGLTASQVLVTSSNANATRYLAFVGGTGNTGIFIDDVTTPLTYNPLAGNIGAKKVTLTTSANVITVDSAYPSVVLTDGANISTFGIDSFAVAYSVGKFTVSNNQGITLGVGSALGEGLGVECGIDTKYELPLINGRAGQAVVWPSSGSGLTWSDMVTSVNGATGAVTVATGLSWSAVTANRSLVAEEGVLANISSGTLTLTLPTTAALGKVIRVSGMQNTWRITQNASQKINFGKTSTTVGTGGYLESSNARDAVELVCCVANTEWNVISSIGNITIV